MPDTSAGLLVYRQGAGTTEVLLVHPGGPFWAKKDAAAWSIPKGIAEPGEDALAAAQREYREETGGEPPGGPCIALGAFRQASGKVVVAFAVAGDFDVATLSSNSVTLEWPPRSGRRVDFPEVDRAAWFGLADAAVKIHKGQLPILTALAEALAGATPR